MLPDNVFFNVSAFICALVVLEKGADIFVDHTVIVAQKTGIPQGIIALLTAGAEWEELAVVIFAVSRGRPALALGNILGSCISNILGAFSLGLLFYRPSTLPDGILFDQSSRIYAAVLTVLTLAISPLLYLKTTAGAQVIIGYLLIATFAVYIASIAYAIVRGRLAAPELSDSDSDSDSGSDASNSTDDENTPISRRAMPGAYGSVSAPTVKTYSSRHSTLYHISLLITGFAAILLSSFVLTQASTSIIDALGMSDVVFGIVFLSIATTLPEKFVAVSSGRKAHLGVMAANTVGSNIFLLTLCLGVTYVYGESASSASLVEIAVLLASTLALGAVVWSRSTQRTLTSISGIILLAAYLAFILYECSFKRS